MPNELYVVGKRQTSLTGKTHRNIQGFDYKDEATGLTLNVRDGDPEIRILGQLIKLEDLKAFITTYAKP